MKVAFIIISFGEKYINNAKQLIESIKIHLINCNVDIHLISDIQVDSVICHTSTNIDIKPTYNLKPSNIIKLTKFERVLQIRNKLEMYDLIYLLDSDCLFVNDTTVEEIIPHTRDHISCVKHPWQTNGKNEWLVDNRPITTACIENTEIYIQSCFWGAYNHKFFEAISEMNNWIWIDIKNDICAKWFEESHFNKYILYNTKTILKQNFYNFPKSLSEYKNLSNKTDIKILHFNV